MAQTNYTPISLYYSTTASAVPLAANLVQGELAINTNDGKLYYEDSSGVVRVLATKSTGTIGGSTTQVQYNNAGSLAGSANFIFDGSNLGLGVTPSAWSALKGFQIGTGFSFGGSSVNGSISSNSFYDGANWKYITSTFATRYDANFGNVGAHAWLTAPSGTAGNTVTFTQAMTLDASGNLGIGTSSPSSKLQVGTGAAASTVQAQFLGGVTVFENTGATASVPTITFNNDLDTGINGPSGNTLALYTGGSERMRIDSSGSLLVGTTTNNGRICATIDNSDWSFNSNQTGSGAKNHIRFLDTGTPVGSITSSGSVTSYNVTSDQRLKTNVVDATSGNIDSIKVRSFDWIADGSHQEYGMIAQELIEVAPYAVTKFKNPDDMMQVDYSKLVPMMIKEIQDLKQRIATLENK
jgi:hypothetical protein